MHVQGVQLLPGSCNCTLSNSIANAVPLELPRAVSRQQLS
jgi:hypothetical protein